MIPKKIHYFWFGRNEKPQSVKKCIASWQNICPDYEIIEWNEDNFDVNYNAYMQYCYKNQKWAFLSDLTRLIVIYQYGGIYFDTDVELIKKPDFLLNYEAFFGFETKDYIATGLGFGARAQSKIVLSMINQYEKLQVDDEGNYQLVSCPKLNTKALLQYGFKLNGEEQIRDGTIVLPVDYMNPFDDPTGQLKKTENTISIHWYSKSWLDKKAVLRSKLTRPFHRLFGTDCFRWLKK